MSWKPWNGRGFLILRGFLNLRGFMALRGFPTLNVFLALRGFLIELMGCGAWFENIWESIENNEIH